LVISEEDLQKAIGIIQQALIDLDEVRLSHPIACYDELIPLSLQLEEIPGEAESEKGFRDELSC
jgi:hypothetical protein